MTLNDICRNAAFVMNVIRIQNLNDKRNDASTKNYTTMFGQQQKTARNIILHQNPIAKINWGWILERSPICDSWYFQILLILCSSKEMKNQE
jgi:hypothetical protein